MRKPRDNRVLNNAKQLRKNMTRQERRLWFQFLRDYPYRFRRQELIGRYIVDFYCDKAKLCVELDGGQHYETSGKRYDAGRTAYLQGLGLTVLRFSNLDIDRQFDAVCTAIDSAVTTALPHPSVTCGDSSPQGEPELASP